MIQRIQSVYLLLGALCLAALSVVDPLWHSAAATTLAWYVPVVAILGALTVIVALVSIFLYKDRKKQLKTILALQTLTIAFLVIVVVGLFLAGDFDSSREDALSGTAMLVLLVPVAAYVFFYLARRGVERDINLVKSMDRLR